MSPFTSSIVGLSMAVPPNILIAAMLVVTILVLFTLLEIELAQAFGLKEALINCATNVFIVVSVVAATWIAVGYP